jgi:hypothetical protein
LVVVVKVVVKAVVFVMGTSAVLLAYVAPLK